MENIRYNVGRGQRLALFICVAVLCMITTAVLVAIIGVTDTARVRIGTVIQDVIGFAVPAVVVAVIVTRHPADLLMIARPKMRVAFLMLCALATSVPAMNALIEWNSQLPLTEYMAETSRVQAEVIKSLFGGTGAGSLVAALLIIGVMAPITEELLFRGCLQRLLGSMINRHSAIWIAAAVFSFVHFDMGGFVPRVLLGALFGYAMLWSGSLWAAVACHAFNNCMAVTAMWLESRGSEVGGEMQSVGAGDPVLTAISAAVTVLIIWSAARRRVSQTSCG